MTVERLSTCIDTHVQAAVIALLDVRFILWAATLPDWTYRATAADRMLGALVESHPHARAMPARRSILRGMAIGSGLAGDAPYSTLAPDVTVW